MKFLQNLLIGTFFVTTTAAQAGVVVGGTRLIYDGAKKESSLSVNNPDHSPYLIQSWVEAPVGVAEKAPFMITPPLFRLDGGQQNVLRVVRAGGNLPGDRESLYWMSIKSIPSSEKKEQGQNTLQVAVKTRIKLIFRPQGLKGVPEEVAQDLKWKRNNSQLEVNNPTPFYMNFHSVTIGGKQIKGVTFVAPMSNASFALPAGVTDGSINWKIISDYGGVGAIHTGIL